MRWKKSLAAGLRLLKSDRFTVLVTGTAIGCGLACGVALALGTVGFSWAASLGLIMSAAIGLDLGWRFFTTTTSRASACAKVGFAVWVFFAPALADAALTQFGIAAGSFANTQLGAITAGLLLGGITLGLPSLLAACAIAPGARNDSASGAIGIAFGLVAAPLIPVALGGAQLVALVAAGLVAMLETVRVSFGQTSGTDTASANTTDSTLPRTVLSYFVVGLCGAAIPIIARVMNQTMLASAQVLMWSMATLLIAAMLGLRTTASLAGRFPLLRTFAGRVCFQPVTIAAAGVALIATFALFPLIVQTQLFLNSAVPFPRILLSARGLLAAAFLFPIGLAVGSSLKSIRASRLSLAAPMTFFAFGAIVSLLLTPLVTTPVLAISVTALMAVAFCVAVRSHEGNWVPGTLSTRLAGVCALAAVACSPVGVGRFDPSLAAQLLFSSAVFHEYRAGTDAHLLLATNDGRLLSMEETNHGIQSTWRFAGSRIQVRQDGFPVSLTSTNAETCPQAPMATLPAVLPVLMHESPDHILFLGDSGPAAEATTLMFPIQSLTAVNLAERTVDLTNDHYQIRNQDDRFSRIHSSPAIAVTTLESQRYDIIVCRPPEASLPHAAPYYTAEFHRRAARCLTPEGFYCQTFNQIDFGAEPIRRLMKSVSRVFPTVAAFSLEGGELMVVATHSDTIIRPGLARRTSFGHVRRILDDLGWDWSKLLGIGSIDSEAVAAILSTYHHDNSLANASFFWDLPVETMRWGDKTGELRMQIAGYQRRILDQLEEDEFRDEAARRLNELGQEAELLFGFPDEPWMYRKTLRTRLTQNPRPPQEVVADNRVKRVAHEVDTYRIKYFKTLSNATKRVGIDDQTDDNSAGPRVESTELTRQTLGDLESFVSPTEPLVSYFASHELVRLHQKLKDSPADEFRHRLHTIYFVPGMTRSVREVVGAMDLLVEHPELVPDPADRWDQMNSLLQVLMGRWRARRDVPPRSSRVALNDIEKTLQAIEEGLSAMKEWQDEAAIDVELCDNRETFLRRRLERPLRRYRAELLPHHYKAEGPGQDQAADQFRTLGN